MGIRYYAYPLAPEFVDRAKQEPYLFLSDDPLADAWSTLGSVGVEMLYLDKCWPFLRALTCSPSGQARTAFEMFEGEVKPVHDGCAWIPWVKVLPPDVVDAVARDLTMFGEDEVMSILPDSDCRFDPELDLDYVLQFLHRAQEFCEGMQQRDWGLIYMID